MQIQGYTYDERMAAGDALIPVIKKAAIGDQIGEYQGFKVKVIDQGLQASYNLVLVNPDTGEEHISSNFGYDELTSAGTVARLANISCCLYFRQ
jgi:hypothetical protein